MEYWYDAKNHVSHGVIVSRSILIGEPPQDSVGPPAPPTLVSFHHRIPVILLSTSEVEATKREGPPQNGRDPSPQPPPSLQWYTHGFYSSAATLQA